MEDCQCGGVIGKMCREGVRGRCWLLWSVRDGGAEDGAENALDIAKKRGKSAGLSTANTQLNSLAKTENFKGCPNKQEAIKAVNANKRQILSMPD